MVQTYISGFCL